MMSDWLLRLWCRVRQGVVDFPWVRLVPVLLLAHLLVAWLVAGPYLLSQAVQVLSSPEGPWVAAAAVYVCVAGMLMLRMVRAGMRPRPDTSAQLISAGNDSLVAWPKMAGSGSLVSRAVPERLMRAWMALCRDYPTGYAEWVAANLSGQETYRQVLDFAAEHHGHWSEANAPEQLGHHRKAHHEAAHAVVAHEMDCTITRMSLVPEDKYDGHTSFQMPVPRVRAADQHFILMMVLLAGRDADLAGGLHDTGSGSDMERLVRCAAAIISTGQCPAGHEGPLTSDALVASAASTVGGILAARAETVNEVAELVAEHQVVSGHYLRQVFARAEAGAVPHT